MLPQLLNDFLVWLDGVVPVKNGRTALVIIGGLIYELSGLVTGHLTPEQASKEIVYLLGLAFAALHKTTPS